MSHISENLLGITSSIKQDVELCAVSKTKPVEDVLEAYNAGQRVFGENKVQEMCDKFEYLPKDIEWHMIGHLQTNKVKYITDFVHLIHGVDSEKLLKEISKQAIKSNRVVNCLIQIYVAEEETKFGFSIDEALELLNQKDFSVVYPNVKVCGLMAMASNTDDNNQIRKEFNSVKKLFDTIKETSLSKSVEMKTLSMGMSGDYKIAIECGSNLIRVGSSIFGNRQYSI